MPSPLDQLLTIARRLGAQVWCDRYGWSLRFGARFFFATTPGGLVWQVQNLRELRAS